MATHYKVCEDGITRNATSSELAQIKIDVAEFEAKQAVAEAKATQRQAILDRLGLTADEAKLLLG